MEKALSANRMELVLSGLDCPHCAAKIEADVARLEGVSSSGLNFVTKLLTVEIAAGADAAALRSDVISVVHKHEPGVDVRGKAPAHSQDGDGRAHGGEDGLDWRTYVRLGIGAALFAVGLIAGFEGWLRLGVFGVSYLFIGFGVLSSAVRNLLKGELFDENFLMTVASLGAFAIGEYPEAVAVMLFYEVGETLQGLAVNRSRRSITALMDIKPEYANRLLESGETERLHPEEIAVDERILVRAGERVPLDGLVVDGTASLDTSALTGESAPRDATPGSEVLAGFINKNGLLTVRVTKPFGESVVAKILDLVQNASAKKAPTERFITRFAKYYTPAVVGVAALIAVGMPLLTGAPFTEWLHRALIFLVISCPCALVISIPLGFFGGIGAASKQGILVKGSSYLELLDKVDTIVFDKTGTLTKGVFAIRSVRPAEGVSPEALLESAAYAEYYSGHPIALSIAGAYGAAEGNIDKARLSGYEEIAGRGVSVLLDGKRLLAGNIRLLNEAGIPAEDYESGGSVVHIAADGRYLGSLVVADSPKDDAKEAIGALHGAGVNRVVMLTGDRAASAKETAETLGITEYYAGLLPDQKVERLEALSAGHSGRIAFVGDGINDAPVLARADVGLAMGGLGSDAAIEAADVVIMTDEPSKVAQAIRIAHRTKRIVWQNIGLAFGVKLIVMALGTLGMANMWEAVFADVGVALLAVLNAMRVARNPGGRFALRDVTDKAT